MLAYPMPKGMGFAARKRVVAFPWDVKSSLAESRRYILALKCKVLRRFFIKKNEQVYAALSYLASEDLYGTARCARTPSSVLSQGLCFALNSGSVPNVCLTTESHLV